MRPEVPPSCPGPKWVWAAVWSLQGAAVLAGGALPVDSGLARFGVTGLLAGLPLAGLYAWLSGR